MDARSDKPAVSEDEMNRFRTDIINAIKAKKSVWIDFRDSSGVQRIEYRCNPTSLNVDAYVELITELVQGGLRFISLGAITKVLIAPPKPESKLGDLLKIGGYICQIISNGIGQYSICVLDGEGAGRPCTTWCNDIPTLIATYCPHGAEILNEAHIVCERKE